MPESSTQTPVRSLSKLRSQRQASYTHSLGSTSMDTEPHRHRLSRLSSHPDTKHRDQPVLSSYSVSYQELLQVSQQTQDPILGSTLKYLLHRQTYHKPHQINPLIWRNHGQGVVGHLGFRDGDHEVRVGSYYPAVESPPRQLATAHNRPFITHLNVGSFGLDIDHTEVTDRYYALGKKLVEYVEKRADQTLVFNFQDVPQEEGLFDEFRKRGFDLIFIPFAFFGEGNSSRTKPAGLLSLINRRLEGYDVQLSSLWLEHHVGSFPHLKHYKNEYGSRDHLHLSSTLFFLLKTSDQKQSYLIGNTYMSPFSSQETRLEVAQKTINNFADLVESQQRENKPVAMLITRLTGDFNPYGVNTLRGPLGLVSGNPWSFLQHAAYGALSGWRPWRLLQGKSMFVKGGNPYNVAESEQMMNFARQRQIRPATDSFGRRFVTMQTQLSDYAPGLTKPLFSGGAIDWSLDFCFYPEHEGWVYSYVDSEPYGEIDHKSLVVSL
jgi:hypothetical protein